MPSSEPFSPFTSKARALSWSIVVSLVAAEPVPPAATLHLIGLEPFAAGFTLSFLPNVTTLLSLSLVLEICGAHKPLMVIFFWAFCLVEVFCTVKVNAVFVSLPAVGVPVIVTF